MRLKSVDLIVVSLFAAAAVTLADVGALNGPVGVLVGLPIVLIVPGHAIAAVIFPPQSRHPIERLTISMGLSLVMVILCALILDLTPAGMTTASWALCLASVTILAAILAYWRRETRPPAEAARTGTSESTDETHDAPFKSVASILNEFRMGLRARDIILVVVALVLLAGAVIVATTAAAQRMDNGFTQLSMLPGAGQASHSLTITIESQELEPTQYRLDVVIGASSIASWSDITLNPGQRWSTTVTASGANLNGATLVDANLYRLDKTGVYRHVDVWLNP